MDLTLKIISVRSGSTKWNVRAQDCTGGELSFCIPKEWATPKVGDEVKRYYKRGFNSLLIRMDLNGETIYRAQE